MALLNWLKSVFLSDDDFKPRVKKKSNKIQEKEKVTKSKEPIISDDNIWVELVLGFAI